MRVQARQPSSVSRRAGSTRGGPLAPSEAHGCLPGLVRACRAARALPLPAKRPPLATGAAMAHAHAWKSASGPHGDTRQGVHLTDVGLASRRTCVRARVQLGRGYMGLGRAYLALGRPPHPSTPKPPAPYDTVDSSPEACRGVRQAAPSSRCSCCTRGSRPARRAVPAPPQLPRASKSLLP